MRPLIAYDVDVSGIKETSAKLKEVKRRTKNLEPVFKISGTSLKKYLKSNFTSSGLQVGGWAPLDVKYASWKAINFPGAPLMVRTGALFNSVAVVGPDVDAHDTYVTYSVDQPSYAKFHQYGTTKMAKREILFTPEIWLDELQDKINKYIADGTLNGD